MKSLFTLGRVFGIPIRLHYTWLVVFVLLIAVMVTYFPVAYPIWQRVIFGLIANLLFLLSIIVHELAHSLITIHNGIKVRSINLFVFGGMSEITGEARSPLVELLIALIGPLASLVLASLFYLGHYVINIASGMRYGEIAITGLDWMAFINVMLAIFNLIPGYPLDGGRALRAVIWMSTGNYSRATRIATIIGRTLGFILIVAGVVLITGFWPSFNFDPNSILLFRIEKQEPQIFNGLWLLFIGWFLENAANISYQQTILYDALKGLTARNVMSDGRPSVDAGMNINNLVKTRFMKMGKRCFLVNQGVETVGLVTIRNVKMIPQARWDSISVEQVMTPMRYVKTTTPTQPAISLLEQMTDLDINQVPVIENHDIIGMVSRDDLQRFLKTRLELGQ